MTFDNEMELRKVKQLFPDAELVLRIRVDDSKSVCKVIHYCSVNFKQNPDWVEMKSYTENFAVSRSSSKNRKIKMPRKIGFAGNREIKMHKNSFFLQKNKME